MGFFAEKPDRLAQWLHGNLMDSWKVIKPMWSTAEEAFSALTPKQALSRYAWIPLTDGWSILLNDTPLGTDVGLLPSRAAETLKCRAIRATFLDDDMQFPARILEVYGPAGQLPFGLERSIAVANDGGRWVFETAGSPFPFEIREAYSERVKANRFSGAMLFDYLRQLGVPVGVEPRWSDAIVVERTP